MRSMMTIMMIVSYPYDASKDLNLNCIFSPGSIWMQKQKQAGSLKVVKKKLCRRQAGKSVRELSSIDMQIHFMVFLNYFSLHTLCITGFRKELTLHEDETSLRKTGCVCDSSRCYHVAM